MSSEPETRSRERAGQDLAESYAAKVRAEMRAADLLLPGADVIPAAGSLTPVVLAVKGSPGPAELAGGSALSGADGEALRKALTALGFDAERLAAVVSRPTGDAEESRVTSRLRLLVSALDPDVVLALDVSAGADVAGALRTDVPLPGNPVRAGYRTMLVVDGLESSLADEQRKRRVWAQLRVLGRSGGR